jgi:hypothetical protein
MTLARRMMLRSGAGVVLAAEVGNVRLDHILAAPDPRRPAINTGQ